MHSLYLLSVRLSQCSACIDSRIHIEQSFQDLCKGACKCIQGSYMELQDLIQGDTFGLLHGLWSPLHPSEVPSKALDSIQRLVGRPNPSRPYTTLHTLGNRSTLFVMIPDTKDGARKRIHLGNSRTSIERRTTTWVGSKSSNWLFVVSVASQKTRKST